MCTLSPVQDLADGFLKSPTEDFPRGKLVAGRVLAVNPEKRTVDLSLRATVVVGKFMHKLSFEDLKEGMKVSRACRSPRKSAFLVCDADVAMAPTHS